MKKTNIIILGSEGKLASDIQELLSFESNLKYQGYSKRQCDITNEQDLKSVLNDELTPITHCINCAGLTDVDYCENNEEEAMQINATSLKTLSELCIKKEIHLTHISTNFVFDGTKTQSYLEQDQVNPISIYGKSKLAGEGWVRNMGDKGLIIRTAWLYGKNGKNFIDTVLNKLELGININIINNEISTPTYSMDLANAIIQLATNYKSGVFHVTNSGQCTWYEFMIEAAKLCKYNPEHLIPVSCDEIQRKAERPKYSVLSMNRLNRTLPEQVRNWKDALYQYLIEVKRVQE